MQLLNKEVYGMSGKRYLLDTNAAIALLQGNNQLLQYLQDAEWISTSVICQIEFLTFSGLSDQDKEYFNQFLQRIEVIGLETSQTELIDLIIKLRQEYRLKLPDAIIAGTAIQHKAILITADNQLKIIRQLDVIDFA